VILEAVVPVTFYSVFLVYSKVVLKHSTTY
jgi:hypothetical protein